MSAGQHHDSERPPHRSTLTGARNDNSSLFSLDLIRRAEAVAASMPSQADDDVGVIDLGELADLARSGPSRVDSAPLIVSASASLFSASPASVPPEAPAEVKPVASFTDPPPRFSPKRANLFLAMGAVGVVACSAAAFLVMQSGAAPDAAASATMVAAPAAPLPAPSVIVAPAPVAAMTPGQRAATPELPKAAIAPVKAPSGPRSASLARPRAEAKEPAPKEETRPAAPVCDLTCQMQRAVAATK